MTTSSDHKMIQSLLVLFLMLVTSTASAFHTESHFEDSTTHKIVYQLNKADTDYIESVLFSAGELLRKYGDDIHIVIATIGPGLHLLGTKPGRPIKKLHQQRASSLASYGVEFHACGNTMKGLGWKQSDLVDYASVVTVGVDDVMLLQEKGYSYFSW